MMLYIFVVSGALRPSPRTNKRRSQRPGCEPQLGHTPKSKTKTSPRPWPTEPHVFTTSDVHNKGPTQNVDSPMTSAKECFTTKQASSPKAHFFSTSEGCVGLFEMPQLAVMRRSSLVALCDRRAPYSLRRQGVGSSVFTPATMTRASSLPYNTTDCMAADLSSLQVSCAHVEVFMGKSLDVLELMGGSTTFIHEHDDIACGLANNGTDYGIYRNEMRGRRHPK